MPIRVPLLLERVNAVMHRLDSAATRAFDPPGTPASGYDDLLDEPVVYADPGTGARTSSRRELAAIRIPCQVEMLQEDRLRQLFTGAIPSSSTALVFHRRDLVRLALIDPTTREPLIRINDRVSVLERIRTGAVVRALGPGGAGLFIFEVRGGSWGFGPDGHDLEIAYLNDRPQGTP